MQGRPVIITRLVDSMAEAPRCTRYLLAHFMQGLGCKYVLNISCQSYFFFWVLCLAYNLQNAIGLCSACQAGLGLKGLPWSKCVLL